MLRRGGGGPGGVDRASGEAEIKGDMEHKVETGVVVGHRSSASASSDKCSELVPD